MSEPDSFEFNLLPYAISLACTSLLVCAWQPMAWLVLIGDISQWQCQFFYQHLLKLFFTFDLDWLAHLPQIACNATPFLTPGRSHIVHTLTISSISFSRSLLTNGAIFLWQRGGPHIQIIAFFILGIKQSSQKLFLVCWMRQGEEINRNLNLSWTTTSAFTWISPLSTPSYGQFCSHPLAHCFFFFFFLEGNIQ